MKEKLFEDLKQTMKQQDKFKLMVLRSIKGAIQLEEIKNKREVNDEEFAVIISKQIKMRKEAISDFKKGNREDLVTNANKEIEILNLYLPKQLSNDELDLIITNIINAIKPLSKNDMGKIMGKVVKEVKGKADLSLVSQMIKEKLNNI